MKTAHILFGGPERILIDGAQKKWRFEDHPYCGPVVIGKRGDPLEVQPPENSSFWVAVNLWYAQGKRTHPTVGRETWCIWDKPTMQKMRHIGGNNYVLVHD
jgi:hypothetical protein